MADARFCFSFLYSLAHSLGFVPVAKIQLISITSKSLNSKMNTVPCSLSMSVQYMRKIRKLPTTSFGFR